MPICFVAAAVLAAPISAGTEEPGRFCPSNLQPVCAADGGAVQTFPNACFAERAGFRVLHQGGCEGQGTRSLIPRVGS